MINVSLVLYKHRYSELGNLIEVLSGEQLVNHVYVIDNSPTDAFRHEMPGYQKVHYIHTGKNLGYGAGHNIAIRKCSDETRYHLVVNPDITLDPGTLDKLYAFMEQHPDVAHVMPKILNEDGSIQYVCKLVPTPQDLFLKRFFAKVFSRSSADKFQLKFTGYRDIMNVPYLSGCFMFLRTAALKEVGMFDERFFMYPEDIDLTRRLHEKYRTIFYPYVSVTHGHAWGFL